MFINKPQLPTLQFRYLVYSLISNQQKETGGPHWRIRLPSVDIVVSFDGIQLRAELHYIRHRLVRASRAQQVAILYSQPRPEALVTLNTSPWLYYLCMGLGCLVTAFWEIAAHLVGHFFIIVFCLIVILVTSHFGLERGICLLIAQVPVHCTLVVFPMYRQQSKHAP